MEKGKKGTVRKGKSKKNTMQPVRRIHAGHNTQGEEKETELVKEYKYCLRCGRQLRNPEARILGYGKICYSKIKEVNFRKRLFTIN